MGPLKCTYLSTLGIPSTVLIFKVESFSWDTLHRNLKKKEAAVVLKRINQSAQNLAKVHNLPHSFDTNKKFSFAVFDIKLWLQEENILHKSCAFG